MRIHCYITDQGEIYGDGCQAVLTFLSTRRMVELQSLGFLYAHRNPASGQLWSFPREHRSRSRSASMASPQARAREEGSQPGRGLVLPGAPRRRHGGHPDGWFLRSPILVTDGQENGGEWLCVAIRPPPWDLNPSPAKEVCVCGSDLWGRTEQFLQSLRRRAPVLASPEEAGSDISGSPHSSFL